MGKKSPVERLTVEKFFAKVCNENGFATYKLHIMAKEDKFADEMLTDEQLDNVAGGFWLPNALKRKCYEDAGIKIVDNYFSCDEFWYARIKRFLKNFSG